MVFAHMRATFGSGGAVFLDTTNSKGVCAINSLTVPFSGATTNSSSTVGTVSSFQGLFTGMNVTGSTGSLQTTTTIGTVSAALDSLTLSKQAILTGAANNLFASGGQYQIQFGTQAALRLDSYFKLLQVQHSFDLTTSSAIGTATQAQLAPQNPSMLLVSDQTKVRTIPATSTSGSTDCSVTVQFGQGSGVNFVAGPPGAGEAVRITFVFGNSSAV